MLMFSEYRLSFFVYDGKYYKNWRKDVWVTVMYELKEVLNSKWSFFQKHFVAYCFYWSVIESLEA